MNITSLVISVLIAVALAASVFHSMWSLSKKLVIPMQICLFILLVLMLFKTFGTKENFDRLNEQVGKSGIVTLEEKAVVDSVKTVGDVIKTDGQSVAQPQSQTPAEPKEEKCAEPKEEEKPARKLDKPDFTKFM